MVNSDCIWPAAKILDTGPYSHTHPAQWAEIKKNYKKPTQQNEQVKENVAPVLFFISA